MHVKTAGAVGLISALAAAGVQAAPASESAVPVAASYAELLTPVPNAMERLRASDAELANRPAVLIEAQYAHHHHHHQGRRHWRRHHHHHHNNY